MIKQTKKSIDICIKIHIFLIATMRKNIFQIVTRSKIKIKNKTLWKKLRELSHVGVVHVRFTLQGIVAYQYHDLVMKGKDFPRKNKEK